MSHWLLRLLFVCSGAASPTKRTGKGLLSGKRKLKKKWMVSMIIPQFAPLSEHDRKKLTGSAAHHTPETVRAAVVVCGSSTAASLMAAAVFLRSAGY